MKNKLFNNIETRLVIMILQRWEWQR